MRRTASLLLILCFSLFAQPEEPPRVGVGDTKTELSLAQTIEMALANNLQIEIERTNIQSAAESAAGARGYLDPQFRIAPRVETRNIPTSSALIGADGKLEQDVVMFEGSWDQRLPWWGANIRVALENSRETTSNPFDALSPFNSGTLGATLNLPLNRHREIDGFRANLRVANKQVDLSETQFETRVIAVIAGVEESYWNLVAARQNVLVTSEAVELAREQLARTQRMIDSGTLAPVELAAAEAELERRIDTWYSSIGLVTQVENAFKTLVTKGATDLLWDDRIIPSEERTLEPPAFANVREAVEAALERRTELHQVDLQTETNEIQKELARNQTKTGVSFIGGVSLAGLSGTVADTQNPFSDTLGQQFVRVNELSGIHGLPPLEFEELGGVPTALVGSYWTMWESLFRAKFPTAFAGVQIDFTGRNRAAKAELERAAIAERRLKLQRAQLEQTITAEVRNALQAIQTARQRITAAEASARAAQEKLDSEIRLFRTGESTNFLVLTRQNELADSRQRAVVARLDFNKAVAKAQQALGTTLTTYNIELR